MNYYQFHLIDYAATTRHLSWKEDVAFRRLLDAYHFTERPIPADIAQACHLVRAESKDERQAVRAVLEEFFELREDGWHNRRCDDAIALYRARKGDSFWAKLPREVRTAIEAARRASKLKATPQWLSQEHRAQIRAIYAQARELWQKTGVAHDVDHIVPLRGEGVCGLHVPWNLRAIPAEVNRSKGRNLLKDDQ